MLAFDSPWWVITAIAIAALLRVWWAGAGYLRRHRAGLLEFADSVLIALLLVFCILRPFVIQAFFIPSGSMENTLLINDRILVNKFIYFFREPQHGDIAVFRAPKQADPGRKDFIKRVMGLPGDRLSVHEGKVFRNGQPLDEPYIKEPPAYNWPVIGRDEFAPGVLLTRENGGREWEGIMEDGLPGRVGEVLVPPNCVVMMGDNRNDSNDSTKWHDSSLGAGLSAPFVPRENVLGQAKLIFWPVPRMRVLH
jgi:signal peptidase I